MKTLLALVLTLLAFIRLEANPIIIPSNISELYFEGTYWYLEIDVSMHIDMIDSMALVTSTDTARFLPGLSYTNDFIAVITRDSLITPIDINPEGDNVYIGYYNNGDIFIIGDGMPFSFGSMPNSNISFIRPGQSIVNQQFVSGLPYETDYSYSLVRESQPSIGYNLYQCSTRATVEGYVYDLNQNPFFGVCLRCPPIDEFMTTSPAPAFIATDSSGYFQGELFGVPNTLNVRVIIDDYTFGEGLCDTLVDMEPDSIYYFEFVIDTLLLGKNNLETEIQEPELSCHPNPVNESAVFEYKPGTVAEDGVIKVFATKGEIVSIIPVSSYERSVPFSCNGLKPGNYYYYFESTSFRTKTGQLIVTR